MLRLLLVSLALVACGSSRPTAPPANDAAPRVAAVLPFGLDWLPADTSTVVRFPGGTAPLIDAVAGLHGAPPCVAELRGKLDVVYTISRHPGDRPVTVALGGVGRDALEACVTQLLAQLADGAASLTRHRDGAVTEWRLGATSEWVGYGDDGRIVYASDRARVTDVLATRDRLGATSPLAALLPRISATDGSLVTIDDYTSRAFGAASIGAMMVISKTAAGTVPVRLLAPSPADATALHDAIGATARRPDLPAVIAQILVALRPRVDGAEVEIDVAPIFTMPGAIEALSSFLGVGAAP